MAKKTELEQRLEELDGLRKRGVINDEEYQTQRSALMAAAPAGAAPAKKGGGILRIGAIGCGGLVALVVLTVVIVSVTSGGDDEPQQTSSSATQSGDVRVALAANTSGEIAAAGNAGKRSRVTILEISDNVRSTNQFSQPPAGKKYWGARVEVENIGTQEVTSLDWKMRDSNDVELGRRFVAGVGDELPVNYTLTPGGKQAGWVLFEIDANATPKWLRADPNPFLKNDLYFEAAQQ